MMMKIYLQVKYNVYKFMIIFITVESINLTKL